MTGFLFDRIVFGPVHSRRLGVSLGINLLPTDRKDCSFNCIYCECGWTKGINIESFAFPPAQIVRQYLEQKLIAIINIKVLNVVNIYCSAILTHTANGNKNAKWLLF